MVKLGNLQQLDQAGVPILINPAWVEYPWLVHGFSTRRGGVSQGAYAALNLGAHVGDAAAAVEENRRRWLAALRAADLQPVFMEQVHGNTVRIVRQAGQLPACDGVITPAAGLLLNVLVADCLPILMCDPRTRTVAAVHAGWRGTMAGIAPRAAQMMVDELGVRWSDLQVTLGPGIGGCCYRVDEPVIAGVRQLPVKLEQVVVPCAEPGQWLLDLAALNRHLLQGAGVPAENILSSGLCTLEGAAEFYSHRRDAGKTGRLVASIGVSLG